MPVLPDACVPVTARDRIAVLAAVGVARVLARRSPDAIGAVLTRLARTARPSTYAEARLARHTVLTVSTRCCGDNACLPRSLATALLCRTRGHWPTWCAGVVAAPPFTAHAWVEAEGRMVDEFVDGTTFTALMSVGAPTGD
ncbi:lasso peptide biosynthesis B2 protein [Saccharothrix longispora]|uniref:lasso peptide biosynthesis B2 protein n=1 Tax=Saccharothrix longispora TaxID=33920 RepID=UPI0028FD4C92|nr:lasso peptide biosynthesis B2 protein [Saccharothrix longispora]MDU0289725.1 lasso peptide biosynthesis B2 protein [Saccharothrix longispora]